MIVQVVSNRKMDISFLCLTKLGEHQIKARKTDFISKNNKIKHDQKEESNQGQSL
jgi:hypothetical protein